MAQIYSTCEQRTGYHRRYTIQTMFYCLKCKIPSPIHTNKSFVHFEWKTLCAFSVITFSPVPFRTRLYDLPSLQLLAVLQQFQLKRGEVTDLVCGLLQVKRYKAYDHRDMYSDQKDNFGHHKNFGLTICP